MAADTLASARERLDPRLTRMGLVLIAAPILATVDATAVGVATQAMAAHFRTSLADVQWVATGYLLAIAMVMPLSGWLSERYGAKRMWIIAVALFTVGSALCGLAWSLPALIGFRLLQALGGGLMNPISQAIVARAAGPSQAGRVLGLLSIPAMFAPVLGPVLGGLVVQSLDWRWIFYVNLPICLTVLPLAVRLLPADGAERDAGRPLDVLGLLLLCPGATALIYGLSLAGERGGPGSSVATAVLGAGLLLIGGYVIHALRAGDAAMIDVRLFARRGFAAATATSFLLGAALYSSMVLLPLFYQQVHHTDAFRTGLLLTPQALGAAAGAFAAGRLAHRYGARAVVLTGLLLMAAGTAVFTQAGAGPAAWSLSVSLVVQGLGLGSVMGPTMGAAYASVGERETPRAASALNVLNRIGGSLGTAIFLIVLENQLAGAHAGPESAFGVTFGWALALAVLALVPAALFPRRRTPPS
ncbi:MDR family MFS transporter [Nonomuraea angiospora]|uniref:MDR family MFS transporter n=1 Tax=Nonomuraea angiospora TaxID=46172 RepID=UPI00331D1C59